ncbi:hypothetical protein BDP27DRAFT_1401883 [Rhodocollybia butyracea]|uniref:Uncharacterized protein n=1 Tax=Rhodocollybia butyracea TaxID=206335 RepID=A0A9P5PXZ3_9AGAR|nr:hypothetical protein BDP27DRAFT_1401883 [Rhodocollybia butyracea]
MDPEELGSFNLFGDDTDLVHPPLSPSNPIHSDLVPPSSPSNPIHSDFVPSSSPSNPIHSLDFVPPPSPPNPIHSLYSLSPSAPIHPLDASPPAEHDIITGKYRVTVLGHIKPDTINEELKSFNKLPSVNFGPGDKDRITKGIKRAMGMVNLPLGSFRYANFGLDNGKKSELTDIDGMCVFALEGFNARFCKDDPCVGYRVKSGSFARYTTVFQLDPKVKEVRDLTPHRKARASTVKQEKWLLFDKQFWAHLSRARFEGSQWVKLRGEIESRDKITKGQVRQMRAEAMQQAREKEKEEERNRIRLQLERTQNLPALAAKPTSEYPVSPPPRGSPHSYSNLDPSYMEGYPDSASKHPTDSPSPPEVLPEKQWSTKWRTTVIGHTVVGTNIDQKLKSFTTLPPLQLGTLDRMQITNSIKSAIRGFSGNSNRYTNEHPQGDNPDNLIPLTDIDGMLMFALEGLVAPCKDRPCAGCHVKSGLLYSTSIYQLNREGRSDSTPFRYTNEYLSKSEWKEFDEQCWERFPLEKFKDPEWGKLKGEIDVRDKSEIDLKNIKHKKSTQASGKRKKGPGEKGEQHKRPQRSGAAAPPQH